MSAWELATHYEHDGDDGDDGEVPRRLDGSGRLRRWVELDDNELGEEIGYKELGISSMAC